MGDRKPHNLGRIILVLNRGKFCWRRDEMLIHDMMIHFWSSQMFLSDADMFYLSCSAYIFNILYIALI